MRILNETITNANGIEEWKDKLRGQQKELDHILKRADSAEKRFAMIQAIFWYHVVNNWRPSLQEYAYSVYSVEEEKKNQPTSSLVETKRQF